MGSFGEVWIFPGTVLFEQAKKYGLMKENYWLGPEPYYIYRGGIGSDSFDWKKRFEDKKRWYEFNTLSNKLIFLKGMLGESRLLKEVASDRIINLFSGAEN